MATTWNANEVAQELLNNVLTIDIPFGKTATHIFQETSVEIALSPDKRNAQAFVVISIERKPKNTGSDTVVLRYNTSMGKILSYRIRCKTNLSEAQLLAGVKNLITAIDTWKMI